MKIAIVHYWLVGMRGGEKVIEDLCRLYPQADIYTHAYVAEAISDTIRAHTVRETFIARLPGGRRHYQKYLPLMPYALEALDLTAYDLVISSEAGPAKGVITRPDALHVCYCHSPMRYIWDQYHVYRDPAGLLTRLMMPLIAHRMRLWDTASATRVDRIVANSRFVAQRVRKAWGRHADVIHPPVAIDDFGIATRGPDDDFYLLAGELVAYKCPDLAIEAFRASGRRLVVLGDGPERNRLAATAPANVTFLGRVSFADLRDHFARCTALVFPGVEDFGIIPLEVMACGRPVVAFDRGGASETVVDGQTGVLFAEQSVAALQAAINRLEDLAPGLDPQAIRAHTQRFSADRFRRDFGAYVTRALQEAGHDAA